MSNLVLLIALQYRRGTETRKGKLSDRRFSQIDSNSLARRVKKLEIEKGRVILTLCLFSLLHSNYSDFYSIKISNGLFPMHGNGSLPDCFHFFQPVIKSLMADVTFGERPIESGS
jgi:hypothetical protein